MRKDGRTDGRTEGQTDMTKLTVVYRNFGKEPKSAAACTSCIHQVILKYRRFLANFFLVKTKTDTQEPFLSSECDRPYLPLRTTVIFGCSSSIPRNRLKRRSVFATLTSRRGCSPSSGGDVDLIPRTTT